MIVFFVFLFLTFFSNCEISKVFNIEGVILGEKDTTHEFGKGNLIVYWNCVVKNLKSNQVSFQLFRLEDKEWIWKQPKQYVGFTDKTRRGHFALDKNFQYRLQVNNELESDVAIEYGNLLISSEPWFITSYNRTGRIRAGGSLNLLLFENVQVISFEVNHVFANEVDAKIISSGTTVEEYLKIVSGETYDYVSSFHTYTSSCFYLSIINNKDIEIDVHLILTFRVGVPSFQIQNQGTTNFISDLKFPTSSSELHFQYLDYVIKKEVDHIYWIYDANEFKTSIISADTGTELFSRRSYSDELISNGIYSSKIGKGSLIRIFNTNLDKNYNEIPKGVIGLFEGDLDFNVTISDFRNYESGDNKIDLDVGSSFEIFLIDGITSIFWNFDLDDEEQSLKLEIEIQNRNKTSSEFYFDVIAEYTVTNQKLRLGGKKGLFGDRMVITNIGTKRVVLVNEKSWVRVELDLKVKDEGHEKWYNYILREYWIIIASGTTALVLCCLFVFLSCTTCSCIVCCQIRQYRDNEKDKEEYIPLM